jgi:hypothetical protein
MIEYKEILEALWEMTNEHLKSLDIELRNVQNIKDEAERESQLKPLRALYVRCQYGRMNLVDQMRKE